jgi:hypothetical protein
LVHDGLAGGTDLFGEQRLRKPQVPSEAQQLAGPV